MWWTLRRLFRQLGYHAAYGMFHRANVLLGANWSLHDLRQLAAYRMARDPAMPLTDVQWVLGHAHLTTTQLYLSAPAGECSPIMGGWTAGEIRTASARITTTRGRA